MCNLGGGKKHTMGIAIVHLMEAITMEKRLLPRSSNMVSIGLHCARMLMNMFRGVIIVKEKVESPKVMKCHYKKL